MKPGDANTRLELTRPIRKKIKMPTYIVLLFAIIYVLATLALLGNSFYRTRGFILQAKPEMPEKVLSSIIQPRALSKLMNGSSTLFMDQTMIMVDNKIYVRKQVDQKYGLQPIDDDNILLFYPSSRTGFVLEDIMIDTIDRDKILVRPKNFGNGNNDVYDYNWYEKAHPNGVLDKEYVLDILLKQDTGAISVADAIIIIGLVKEKELYGYYNGTAMFMDIDYMNNKLNVTWKTKEYEVDSILENVDVTKRIVGIGNCVICVDVDGALLVSLTNQGVIRKSIDADHQIEAFNAYLENLDEDVNQRVYINVYSKDIFASAYVEPFGEFNDETTAYVQYPVILGYDNMCGNSNALALWNYGRYTILKVEDGYALHSHAL